MESSSLNTVIGKRTSIAGVISIPRMNIACHFLHFAQTEDIGLKSALEEKRGVSLTSRKEDLNKGLFLSGIVSLERRG